MASIGLSAYGMTGSDLVQLAVCAEEHGFDALWLGEHVLRPVAQKSAHPTAGTEQHHAGPLIAEDTELTDPWAVHAAIAAVTTRIKLGTAVYVTALRHPLHTARTTITVQELSGGRVIFGVGVGWLEEEFAAFDVPFRTRVSRTEECLEVLRQAWRGEPFSHHGRHFRFDEVGVHPRPVEVPVVLGGNGPKALARAAAVADGWFTSGTPDFDEALRMVTEIRRLRAERDTTDPFTSYVRIPEADPVTVRRYQDHGMGDLIVWADTLWTGRTLDEKRQGLAAAAERLGLKPAAAPPPAPDRPATRRSDSALRIGDDMPHNGDHRGTKSANHEVSLLRPLKAAESVARMIVDEIRTKGLKPGANLPLEATMLKQYGVSRESLREGLRLLEVQGMISIRRGPGGGPIVGTVDAGHLGRVSALFYNMTDATYNELLEAWVWAEGELAERAARNPDAALRSERMTPYVTDHNGSAEDLAPYLEGHTAFHRAVADLSNNRVLALSLQTYGQIVAHHVAVLSDPRSLRDVLVDEHRHIAEAVIAGHARRARTLMESHLEGVTAYVREHIAVPLDEPIEWL
ncbi:TIGR03619 family F420-dependent LLM class oxidoreductase [Mycolicibacterium thermoresistibile]